MATDITGEVSPGELRFLARLRKTNLPNGIRQPVADIAGGTAIEGSDVFNVNGQTRCKYYSSERFIDDQVRYSMKEICVDFVLVTDSKTNRSTVFLVLVFISPL